MRKIPKKKRNFKLMAQPSIKKTDSKKLPAKKTERLKINLPFEEAMKIVFSPKSTPTKK